MPRTDTADGAFRMCLLRCQVNSTCVRARSVMIETDMGCDGPSRRLQQQCQPRARAAAEQRAHHTPCRRFRKHEEALPPQLAGKQAGGPT
eukprot:2524695-Rhodomonas_salina.3